MNVWRATSGAGVAIAIVLAVAWLSGWFEHKIGPDAPVAEQRLGDDGRETVAVELVSEPAVEWASGTIESARRTTVASRLLAKITEVRVAAGDEVADGDVLVLLDDRDLRARVQQAREAVTAAQAQRALAKVELERAEDLLKRGVASRQRFDQATTALQVANADVDRLTRALDEAQTNLSHAEIRAPTAGRIIDRLAEAGDTVAPGQALLRLYDPSALRVESPVRETLAVKLTVGDRIDMKVSAIDQIVTGAIEEIVPYAEPGSRAMLVKTRLPDDRRLYAGMFARVAIPIGDKTRLVIPATAVERIGQLEFVTVLSAGAAARRMVTTGERLKDGRVEVLSGLKIGEHVAAAGG